jgi:hypothetical protein
MAGCSCTRTSANDNRKEATEPLLEDSPVAAMVLLLGRIGANVECTPRELYDAVVKGAGNKLGPWWPKTVSAFGSELRRIAPQLRLNGLAIGFERRRGERIITLKSDSVADRGPLPDEPSF